ncbi:MAG: Rrf2 family transcriptional regulator [Phycisphaerae bacterium]|nr:Rrf2 family transcriptional regulator [Phycisphaerae bacterium]
MLYTTGCEYAIRAMTYIAATTAPGQFCLLKSVTEGSHLPHHFIGKILQSLVKAGLLLSAKGRGGGFALRKDAKEIRLADIIQALDGVDRLDRCVIGLPECDESQPCAVHHAWGDIRERIRSVTTDVTLADLADAFRAKQAEKR